MNNHEELVSNHISKKIKRIDVRSVRSNSLVFASQFLFAVFVLLSLLPTVQAKSCVDMGYYDWCILLTHTACYNGNPYQCKAISPIQWCYVKTGTCSSNQYCTDNSGFTSAQCKTCNNQCSSGQKTCSGNGYQTCVADPSTNNKCMKWSAVISCASNQMCSGGSCINKCTDQCSNGQTRCDANGYDTCTKGSNGCYSWSSTKSCGSGYSYQNGNCVVNCNNQCSIGQKKCDGNGYDICQKDKNGCLIWSSATKCSTNQQCNGGNCVNVCQITSASWSVTNTTDGSPVSIIVMGNGCDGKSVNFNIYQNNQQSVFDSRSATMSNGKATSSWIAVWQENCTGISCKNPNYQFTARIDSNSITSNYLNVGIRMLTTVNLSSFLASHPLQNTGCQSYGTMNYDCMQKMDALGANFTEISGNNIAWNAMTIGLGVSFGGCLLGLGGMLFGSVSCAPSFGAGCAVGVYSIPVATASCGLLSGDLSSLSGQIGDDIASSVRTDGIAKVISSEEASLKSGGAVIVSADSSATGGKIVSQSGGVTKETWIVVSDTGDSILKYARQTVAGDLDTESNDYAIKYIMDRPVVSFSQSAQEGLALIYKLQKQTEMSIGFDSDSTATIAARFFRQEDVQVLPNILKSANLNPRSVNIQFVDQVVGSGGGDITGRMITGSNGITTIQISTGYLQNEFANKVITEDDMGMIAKHATLSHEIGHYVLNNLPVEKILAGYPDLNNGGFSEYLVDMIKFKIDPEAKAATQLEIDKWLLNPQTAMDNGIQEYATQRAIAIKAGRESVIAGWDTSYATKLKNENIDPAPILSALPGYTQAIMNAGDKILNDNSVSSDPQQLRSILISVSAQTASMSILWKTVDSKLNNCSVNCTNNTVGAAVTIQNNIVNSAANTTIANVTVVNATVNSTIVNATMNQSVVANTTANQSVSSNATINQSVTSNGTVANATIVNSTSNQSVVANVTVNQSVTTSTTIANVTVANATVTNAAVANTTTTNRTMHIMS